MAPQSTLAYPTIGDLPSVEDLTRREFIGGALAAALLVACGDDANDETAPTATAASGPTTKMFTDAIGNTVEVPTRPQRIIALHAVQVAPPLLSIGAPIVGIAANPGPWPASLDGFDVTGIPQLGGSNEIDIEQVIALQPDLVVGYTFPFGEIAQLEPTTVERLRQIAPTVFVKTGGQPGDVMPRDVIAPLAGLVGIDANVLTPQQREYDALVAQVRELLGPTPGDFAIRLILFFEDDNTFEFRTPPDQSDVFTDVLEAAGATWLGEPDGYETTGTVSLERLRDIEADILITGTYRADYTDNPLYQSLAVVQAGQIVEAPDLYSGVTYPNYIAQATFLLEQLRAMPQPLRSDLV